MNFFIDAILQPAITSIVEMLLWWAIFRTTGMTEFGGYQLEHYLQYVLWAAFFARISISWMYEYRMVNDVDTGTINAILLRPFSFFSFYWGQLLGYKALTSIISLMIPFTIGLFYRDVFALERLPLILVMLTLYLFFIHTTGFIISSFAFHWNRVFSFSVAKNLILVFFSGELYPLDLLPERIKDFALMLPFPSGVYVPVAYITSRIDHATFLACLGRLALYNILLFGLAQMLWRRGLRSYSGTGA
jgi:ABC-2 type transport system permease protein